MSNTTARRAPVNGSPGGTIAWSEHVEAWESYARQFGRDQSPERIAQRGGFGVAELVTQLGRMPRTWLPDARTRFLRGVEVSIGEWKPRAGTVEDDLRSRLGCVLEATYWDRPYDTRIAAIRGMCDLTTNGMAPAPEADHTTAADDEYDFTERDVEARQPDRRGGRR